MDYYKTLELKRDCTDADIKKSYRQLAIQWHPERNQSKNKEAVAEMFRSLSEAYCVLSDAKLRAIFDQYGEKGLKTGIPNGKGGNVGAWTFNVNPDEHFREFFGSFSPFADFFNEDAGYASLFNAAGASGDTKVESQVINLYCSLEELYLGCTKKQKVVTQKLGTDGASTAPSEKILTVEVSAGWREGTKITFTCEGDEAEDMETGDVVFILREKPHPRFTRSKNDLNYSANLTLSQALTGVTINIPTLDGRTLPIAINQIVTPGSSKRVAGEGMPIPKGGCGNLNISFNVSFPDELSEDQKSSIKDALA
jgi:DnaJ-class molecular chaperone